MGFIARARSLWRGIRRTQDVDAEMNEEFRLHMELRAADLVRAGVPPAEAERRARVEFGGAYNYKEAGRESRGLRGFDALRFSWLDMKLGARMLRKYPWLTLISSAAMGVAIAVGAGAFTTIALLTDPRLPLDEGDRIIGIQVWGGMSGGAVERRVAYDLPIWRAELRSVTDLGAFRTTVRNMITTDGRAEPMRAAEMSASGFRVARVSPLLGRYLVDDDERVGATPVVVIGEELWASHFGRDSAIVGKMVRFGATQHTIVGVMPDGFGFPTAYTMWVPMRVGHATYKPREGPTLYVFGRLAPDATLEQARAEVAALGASIAAATPETHRRLVPRLMPFAQSWFELDDPEIRMVYRIAAFLVSLLLVIICVNVAILVYARTATRQSEIAVRTALGASRSRIVAQLFGEALVLSGLGAVIGLGIISVLASRLENFLLEMGVAGGIPFWVDIRVSPGTLGWIAALGVVSAVIIGVLPALQLTGRRVQLSLQRLAGGGSTVRLGKMWTALIIAEVAVTVALLPAAVFYSSMWMKSVLVGVGFPSEEFLTASLSMDRDVVPAGGDPAEYERRYVTRFALARDELFRRLKSERDIVAATYASQIPGGEWGEIVEVDSVYSHDFTGLGDSTRSSSFPTVRLGRVDASYFKTFDVPLISGRLFGPADADSAAATAIVSRSFAEQLLQGRNPLGRQVRSVTIGENQEVRSGRWYEIVGVVEDFPTVRGFGKPRPIVYHAAESGTMYPANLALKIPARDPATLGGRLRAIAAAVDPALQLRDVRPLDDMYRRAQMPLHAMALFVAAVTLSVLVLSSAGLYALMSVIVTQRRREIGIRIALGADARRVLSSIFSRALAQLGVGAALGLVLAYVLHRAMGRDFAGPYAAVILPVVALFMMAVGVLAALGPARRGLRIQPTAALKEE
jgi:putative ABC transport system permease protein